MIHTVLPVSVIEFYWFGEENGDTARLNEFSADLIFSNFSITNLLRNEDENSTNALVGQ